MKEKLLPIFFIFFSTFCFAQSLETEAQDDISVSEESAAVKNADEEKIPENTDESKETEVRTVNIPPKKAPKEPDKEKCEKAALKDEGKDAIKEKTETIQYGIESEILSLIKDLISNDDPRFSNELYELFYVTKSVNVREKIIEYFTKQSDPCIEDYAVEILQDPYDEKDSTVEALFRYVSEVKTKEAIPCVLNLLDSENETYFSGALSTLGEIGTESEAPYLVEYLDREDLSLSQRQNLMKVLGKLKAESTFDKLVEITQDEEENSFVRMYAAEAIGAMKKAEALPVLLKLFESPDPNFRVYVIKGLSNFETKEAQTVIIQGIKDAHWKVRLESISSCEKMNVQEAVPYIIYRAKNDPEKVIKDKAYEIISKLDNPDCEKFLCEQISDKKLDDSSKCRAVEAALKNSKWAKKEIAELAKSIASDDKKKPLRYNIGKFIAKYPDSAFEDVSVEYLNSKDAATCAIGIDMYASGRYAQAEAKVKEISENEKAGANYRKARKILKID